MDHDVVVFIAFIPAVAVAAAGARTGLVLVLGLRGAVCTEEAGEDGVGPERGTAKGSAATVHTGSRVGTGLQEKLQHVSRLGLHCQVQGAPTARGLRFVEVGSSLSEQSDHLGIFVDDSHMEWGVAFIVFSLQLQFPVLFTLILFLLQVRFRVQGHRGVVRVRGMVRALSEVGVGGSPGAPGAGLEQHASAGVCPDAAGQVQRCVAPRSATSKLAPAAYSFSTVDASPRMAARCRAVWPRSFCRSRYSVPAAKPRRKSRKGSC